jgi:hypothetical protein
MKISVYELLTDIFLPFLQSNIASELNLGISSIPEIGLIHFLTVNCSVIKEIIFEGWIALNFTTTSYVLNYHSKEELKEDFLYRLDNIKEDINAWCNGIKTSFQNMIQTERRGGGHALETA